MNLATTSWQPPYASLWQDFAALRPQALCFDEKVGSVSKPLAFFPDSLAPVKSNNIYWKKENPSEEIVSSPKVNDLLVSSFGFGFSFPMPQRPQLGPICPEGCRWVTQEWEMGRQALPTAAARPRLYARDLRTQAPPPAAFPPGLGPYLSRPAEGT